MRNLISRSAHHARSLSSVSRAEAILPTTKQSVRSFSQSPPKNSPYDPSRALPFSLTARGRNVLDSDEVGGRRMLRMLMFGKPGAGKGTLTGRLVKKYEIVSLSTGDLLRRHIAQRTEVGREAEEIVASGGLLPDEVMLRVVSSELDELRGQHWILDGFPRTTKQAELLDAHLKKRNMPLTLVVNLDVRDDIILRRISDRWVHLPSGRVYNLSYNPPRVPGHDDFTGEPLIKRPDDNPEIFARRLAQFYASTAPIIDYYTKLLSIAQSPLKLRTLSGSTSDEIWPQLDAVVRGGFPSLRERVDVLEAEEKRKRRSLNEAVLSSRLGLNASK
ncbi:ADK domain containing protein [Amanita muscaria]